MDSPRSHQPRTAMLAVLALLFLPWPTVTLAAEPAADQYGGRPMIVYAPSRLPPAGARALVIVLHGGLGNAGRIVGDRSESALNLDGVAERYGFVVAYLNGTPATRVLSDQMLAWNAGGGCCGQPSVNNVDDVGYVKGAVGYLARKYGVDTRRIYGIGHSNGAMMTLRTACEAGLYAAVVAISGPLDLDTESCPAARGMRVLAIHGAEDQNVPLAGGQGTKGLSRASYASEAHSQQVFIRSGATYALQIVPGADHKLDDIEAAIGKAEGVTIAEKAADFFGLSRSPP